MNKIFTQVATVVALLSTLMANAQPSQLYEGFENTGGLTYYQSQGWSFLGSYWNNTSQIYQNGSIQLIPTTSTSSPSANSNTGQISTPLLNLSSGGTISFSYKLDSKLGSQAQRIFTIRLVSASNVSTTLGSFSIGGEVSGNTIQTSPSIVIPKGSGTQKVVIDFTGNGDGNTGMYFDNLSVETSQMILPVKLLSFSNNLSLNTTQLQWRVAENETGSYFELQKSTDAKTFKSIALIFTTAATGEEQYSYTDPVQQSTKVYYRLKVVNKNNSSFYSSILVANRGEEGKTTEVSVLQNPVQSTLALSIYSTTLDQATINIYSTSGVKVYSTSTALEKGTNLLKQPLGTNLGSGLYILEVVCGSEKITHKIIKQ